MDRTLWVRTFSEHGMPTWRCPVCKRGTTSLVPKSLAYKETTRSIHEHSKEEWDPEWIEYVFIAWAECSNTACKHPFAISGTGGVAPDYDEDRGVEWYDYFSPLQCHPMPDIIHIPTKCSENVLIELRAAFSLFWGYSEACAGRIRVALEYLMNHLGVPKRKKGKGGKFYDLTLHGRLDYFANKNPVIGTQLMALKWLGNAGSHDGAVSKIDLLDAFEILEHALAEIVDQRSAKVAALAKKLTKKHAH